MTINQFYIELDNPIRSFFPGQSVSGRVIVESVQDTRIEGIVIVFAGKAAVRWTESHTVATGVGKQNQTRTEIRVYTANEEYFNCQINVAGGHEAIPNGRHAFPFQFTLPPELPTSFNGIHGKIYYYIEAILKRSWKLDRKAMVPFTVNTIIDLNRQDLAPVELRKQKSICCLCCRSGPVGFVLKMGRQGYVPGEYIDIESEIFNQSTRKVNKVELTLCQTTTYRATTKSRSDTKLLCVARGPCVERGQSEAWVGKVLQIPPVPPSTMGKCQIIDIQYSLMVEVDLSGPAVNLKGDTRLIIGTIPLRTTFSGFQSQAYENQMRVHQSNFPDQCSSNNEQPPNMNKNAAAGNPLPSAPGFEGYPDLPPPTYAEAIGGQTTKSLEENIEGQENMAFDEENSTAMTYEPKYITYGWTNP